MMSKMAKLYYWESILKNRKPSTIKLVLFLSLSLLMSDQVFALAEFIPAHKCSISATSKKSLLNLLGPASQNIVWEAEKINSPEDIAQFIFNSLKASAPKQFVEELLFQNPYVQDIKYPKTEIINAIADSKEILDTAGFEVGLDHIRAILVHNVKAFRENQKNFTDKRTYDSMIDIIGVKDQCRLGSCWAYASIAYIELLMKYFKSKAETDPSLAAYKDISEEHLKIAVEHFYAMYILNEVRRTILTSQVKENEELFEQGGMFLNFMAYAKSLGTGVPSKQWAPFKSYKKAMFKDNFLNALKDMALYHHKLLQENERRNPYREFNDGKFENIESARRDIAEQRDMLRQAAFKDVETKVEFYTDDLHVTIPVGGKELSVQEFYQDFILSQVSKSEVWRLKSYNMDQRDHYSEVELVDHNLNIHYERFPYQVRDMKEDLFSKSIKEELDAGKPIYISLQIPEGSVKIPATGESFQTMDSVSGLSTLRPYPRKPKIRGGHALVIVGAEFDVNGNIVSLRVQNSWGEAYGDAGIIHVDISFLRQLMTHLVVLR